MPLPKTLTPNLPLKAWRLQQGWTLDEAAHYLGTTKTSLHRWEAGVYDTPQTIEILYRLLREKKNIRAVQHFFAHPLD